MDPTASPEPPAPTRDHAIAERVVAILEVIICSDYVTQIALGGTLRAFGFSPMTGGRLNVAFVVAETADRRLNDMNGFHVRKQHVFRALDTAASGPVAEGNVGGGTGMVCHGWKGGIPAARSGRRRPAFAFPHRRGRL